MKIYCLVIGTLFVAGAVFLLCYRIYFVLRANTVTAVVIDKVFRNMGSETRSSRAKFLKFSFEHPNSGPTEYVCDTNVLTPLYQVNDSVKLSIWGQKVIVKHWLYVILAPTALLAMGAVCIYVSFEL